MVRGKQVTLYGPNGYPIPPSKFPRRTTYAAAKTNRLTGDWYPLNTDVNQILAASHSTVKARARQLVRDFPPCRKALEAFVNRTGKFKFQSRVKDADGKIDKRRRQQIEDAVNFWMDEADVSGRLHFLEMMRLAKRQEAESGEFLLVKVRTKTPGRYIPFALQMYESDWLTTQNDTHFGAGIGSKAAAAAGTEIYQGIEYDTATGRRIAYHFADPQGYRTTTERIPAERVIHGFDVLRPNQLRGVSLFAAGILLAHDLGDYMDAEIDTAKLAAKYLALVTTADPMTFQSLRTVANPADETQKLETLENAIIEYLRPGESVTFAQSNRPGDNFEPFVRFILRMFAISAGISYELVSGDYQDLNYTVLRGIRNDLKTDLEPHQDRHRWQFCTPCLRAVMDALVLYGKLNLPGYWNNPAPYFKAEWMAQGWPAVDPLKEGRADADAVAARMKSRREIAAARGRDYEEILDELEEEEQMLKERGLTVEQVSNSTKTNPASLDNDDEDDLEATGDAKKGDRTTHLSLV